VGWGINDLFIYLGIHHLLGFPISLRGFQPIVGQAIKTWTCISSFIPLIKKSLKKVSDMNLVQ
jgi:hypothetical protein